MRAKDFIKAFVLTSLVSSGLASPKAAHADPQDPLAFLGPQADQVVSLFANYYGALQGITAAIGFAEDLSGNGQPSFADLLQQLQKQVITELRSEQDDGLTWASEGYAERFHDVITNQQDPLNLPPSQSVEQLLSDATVTRVSMRNIILDPNRPDDAYRLVPHYLALTAVYIAMLKYEGYSEETIDSENSDAAALDYALIGARDAGCSIASGINTAFSSMLFRYRYEFSPYYCSVEWNCPSVQEGQTGQVAYYDCSVDRFQNGNCFVPQGYCAAPQDSLAQCDSEAREHALWQFNDDVVTRLVRADLNRLLQASGGRAVADPACSAGDLNLFSWSELCGSDDYCSVANLALGKTVNQSSTLNGADASRAVDGNTDGSFFDGSVSHTAFEKAWWQVDIGFEAPIGRVVLWNRSDCCSDRLSSYWIEFSLDGQSWNQGNYYYPSNAGALSETDYANTYARFVRVRLEAPNYLSLAEVQVFPPGQ